MKSSKEITEYVLQKRNAHLEKRKVRNTKIRHGASVCLRYGVTVCSFTAVFCISVVGFKYLNKIKNEFSQTEIIKDTTYSTALAEQPTEDDTDDQFTAENTDIPSVTEAAETSVQIAVTASDSAVPNAVNTAVSTAAEKPLSAGQRATSVTPKTKSTKKPLTSFTKTSVKTTRKPASNMVTGTAQPPASWIITNITAVKPSESTGIVKVTSANNNTSIIIIATKITVITNDKTTDITEIATIPWGNKHVTEVFKNITFRNSTYSPTGETVSSGDIMRSVAKMKLQSGNYSIEAETYKIKGISVNEALAVKFSYADSDEYYLYKKTGG